MFDDDVRDNTRQPATTPRSDPLANFDAFVSRLRSRLIVGAREYGNASFTRPMPELVDEIREELLDVVGWSYILAVRLDTLEAAVRAADVPAAPPTESLSTSGPLSNGWNVGAPERDG